ncbi:MAG: hypothetical protein LBO62_04555 [Endomicrobium sp.]|jgi:hypothetical protein|nr:hypothetical protein [Endomicrobium sp.]
MFVSGMKILRETSVLNDVSDKRQMLKLIQHDRQTTSKKCSGKQQQNRVGQPSRLHIALFADLSRVHHSLKGEFIRFFGSCRYGDAVVIPLYL